MNKEQMNSFIQRVSLMGNGEGVSETVNDYHVIVTKEGDKYHLTVWFAHNSKPLHNDYYQTTVNIEASLKRLHYIYY